MRKKFIYVLWALVVGVLLVIALIFTAIAKGWIGYVPPIEELENPNLKFATEIISDDGKMLGAALRRQRLQTQRQDAGYLVT